MASSGGVGGYSSSLSWNTLASGVFERITALISNNRQRLAKHCVSYTDLRLHPSFTDQVQPSGMSGWGGPHGHRLGKPVDLCSVYW